MLSTSPHSFPIRACISMEDFWKNPRILPSVFEPLKTLQKHPKRKHVGCSPRCFFIAMVKFHGMVYDVIQGRSCHFLGIPMKMLWWPFADWWGVYIYIGQLLVLVCSSWLHIHEIWKMSTARKTGRDRSGVIHTYGTKKLHKWWSQMNYICPFTTVWIGGIDQGYGWACVWIGALNSEPRPYIYSIYIYICVCVFAYINVCVYIYILYIYTYAMLLP